jgi:hypothetical protein
MANLGEIEYKLLELLYKRDFDNEFDLKFRYEDFPMSETDPGIRIKEMGYYILRLDNLGYLELGNNPPSFIEGGIDNTKYRNNICSIQFQSIKLSYKGRKFIENSRITLSDKMKNGVLNFVKDLGIEVRNKAISHLATFLLGLLTMYIYLTFFKK